MPILNMIYGATGGGGRLPSAYQEVEYIQSSGWSNGMSTDGQYINTGYSRSTNNGEIKIKYMPLRFGSAFYSDRLGGAYQNSSREFGLYTCYSSPRVGLGGTDIELTGTTLALNTIYKLDVLADNGDATVTINGASTSYTYTGSIGNGYGYTLLASHEEDGGGQVKYACAVKLYYAKMYEGGNLVRDYVPCYRINDSVIGLYDLVTAQFYTNDGTGAFTKGPDV